MIKDPTKKKSPEKRKNQNIDFNFYNLMRSIADKKLAEVKLSNTILLDSSTCKWNPFSVYVYAPVKTSITFERFRKFKTGFRMYDVIKCERSR